MKLYTHTHTHTTNFKRNQAITLISLIVTIIILLILAGISIQLIGGSNGILTRASQVLDVNDKATATEKMELKITYLNMVSYGENTRKANLQEIADGLCIDKEMEYVKLKNQEIATLVPIDVTGETSIFVKMKEYPYEFEIDENLQLASVDGVKIADSSASSIPQEQINSIVEEKLNAKLGELDKKYEAKQEELKKEIDNLSATVALLQSNNNGMKLIKRGRAIANVSCTPGVWQVLETVSLAGNATGTAIVTYSAETNAAATTSFWIDLFDNNIFEVAEGDRISVVKDWLRSSASTIIHYDENTNIIFRALAETNLTPYYEYSILLIPEG